LLRLHLPADTEIISEAELCTDIWGRLFCDLADARLALSLELLTVIAASASASASTDLADSTSMISESEDCTIINGNPSCPGELPVR
jgi:hypothetical protein